MKKKLFHLALASLPAYFCPDSILAQCIETEGPGLIINELGNTVPASSGEYVELIVYGSADAPDAPVNLSNWILDDNNTPLAGVGNQPGHIRFGDCFEAVPPGTLILIYNDAEQIPEINSGKDGMPNADGIWQIPISSPCFIGCPAVPNHESGDYSCHTPSPEPTNWPDYIPMKNQGDGFQIRKSDGEVVHAVYWLADPQNFGEASGSPYAVQIPVNNVSGKAISFNARAGWFNPENFTVSGQGTPGQFNSPENQELVGMILSGEIFNQVSMTCSSGAPASSGAPDGEIQIAITGGAPPYKVVWGQDEKLFNEPGTYTLGGLPEGTWGVQLRDGNQCELTCQAVVAEGEEINICDESEEGCVTIGTETTECFRWSPQTGLTDPQSSTTEACPEQTTVYTLTLTNDEGDILKALQYTVTVQDIGVEIYPASPTVCSGSEQTLEATTWGDRTNYAYAWSNGSTTPTTQVSQGGIYSITVTDTQTGCQEETSAEVAEVSLDASIQPDSEPVCAGQPLALTAAATGTQNELTFEWSTGETGDLISVTQSGPYTVTITDETTGCEGIAEYVLETENPSLQISPESLVICPGGQAELSADPGYQQYEWQFENANGEFTTLPPGADPAVANVNLPGRYRVLATDANGCTVTAEITVGDANSPDAVKAFFVKRGFYCIPINIPEPPGVHSSDPTSGPRSLTGPCEDNDCSNAFCVKDFADLPVEIEGAAAEDLEPLAEAYLAYFHNQFGYSEGKAYITANDQLCACPEFMEIVDNNFNASGLRFWIHLFEAGEGGQDCLFIRANVPGDDNHYPESEARVAFLDGILDYAREHPVGGVMTMAGQILFNAMDGLLDNYADLYTPGASYRETGGSEAVCSSTEGDGLVIMTPAGKPLILPENSTARFGASALRQDDVPDGALSGFTEILSGNQARYYYARLDDQHFWGYQQAGLSGNFLEPNPGNYLPQTLPFQPGTADPKVNLGYKFQNQEGSNYYRLEEHLFTCPLPDEIDDGSGPLADPLPCIGAKTNTNQYDIDLPPVTEANFIAPNKRYIAEWAGGTLVQVPNEQGGYSQIYAQENDGEFIFYIWNCTGEWEPYTPDNIHVLNAVVAAFYGAKYGDEGDYAGDDVTRQFCFDIHPSQLEGVFDRANSEDFGPGNQVDNYARLDAADKAAIESAAQTALSRYGLKIKYIVTRDAVSGLDNTPVNAASLGNNALDDPDNLNDYDLLAWVHLTSDGGGQACFRLTENFYLFDEGPQLEGVEGLNEKLEIRSVMADALKEGGGKHPDQLKDQDPDDQYEDPESPAGAGNENPWRFGIRPDVSEPLNFFTIFKEVGGLGRATIRETEIPGILYLSQGESMFQAPAALCGAGNAIIGNNPFVGIAQGVSFAVSAVKDEEVRRGIGHAITHPVETAQGMYKAKVEAYESPDRTVFYYTLGNDGVTILQALFTGGAGLTKFLKTLKTDARESVEALKKHLDDLGPGSPLHEKVADFTELEGEAFANFLGEVGKDHVKKFVNNPDLARVWKKLQNEAGDLDLANTFKKLPDSHPGFYEKLFETITDGQGNALENAADFFGDLKNNGPLMDAFLEAPGRVKAWKVLDDAGVDIALRRNVDNLKHIDGFENLKPGSLDNIKNELSSLPVDRQEHFLAGLGNVSNNDALGASLTLNRIPEVSEIRAATDKIFQHRVDNGVQWPNKNFGYMEGNLSGGNVQTIPDNIVSSGPAVPVNEQVFDAIEVGGWERFTDSEYKMLNQLARDLGAIPGVPIANQVNPNISGTIKIVSERAYCASCQGVIQKFNELFPGVEVTLIDGVRKID